MKRYCLISFCNIYVLPYAKLYIDAILESGAECDLIFWDREANNGENDNFENCRKFCYQRKTMPDSPKFSKLIGYIKSRRFIIKQLNSVDYDGIIFLQTHAAVAFTGIIERKYKNKYIVDIRDYTLEKHRIYKFFEKRVIDKSFANIISSPAYRKFLPDSDFVMAHNFSPFPESTVKIIAESKKNVNSDPIRISFVGTVRFFEMDVKLLKLFANDERFIINYFGQGSDILADFCKSEGITNVEFYGSFPPEMTSSFYLKTDLINNLYGNHNLYLDYALSNKLYHSGQLYIPILVCPDTYMAEVSLNYNMGFVFDFDEKDAKDKLYEWYRSFDRNAFSSGCDSFIEKVRKENAEFEKTIASFLA